ncbi:hypothetical protein [Streptomyces tremellae]|uniref:Cobyrinic acid a,c-diamide synthase n=1 Tax=Streptomyces tremellae TaxID=1124239 RepID=A0ABP7G7C0_9ACTN
MSLPGADELFRTTGGTALQASSPADRRRGANGEARVPAPAGEAEAGAEAPAPSARPAPEEHSAAAEPDSRNGAAAARSRTAEAEAQAPAAAGTQRRAPEAGSGGSGVPQQAGTAPAPQQQRRKGGRGANRRPSGRERHDEKITVYVSAEELMDLEHARLVLRGEHGLAVDRGRIVREAVAVVLADLESRGDASILVRRLRGR